MSNATAVSPQIYWTTQAREEFDAHIRRIVHEHWTAGGQVVAGNHSGSIEILAAFEGLDRINRQRVADYFATVGGAK